MLLKTNMTTIRIKNMVCPRCVAAVRRLLAEMGCRVSNVELGEAVLEDSLVFLCLKTVRPSQWSP